MPTSDAEYVTFPEQPLWDGCDRAAWLGCGVICALVIAVEDRSLPAALFWLTGSMIRGWHLMPRLIAATRGWTMRRQRHILVEVAIGWALIPGPLVGSLAGILAPLIWNLPITSFQGGLIGLIAGPVVAAVEGVAIASLALGGFRLYKTIVGVPWEAIEPGRLSKP